MSWPQSLPQPMMAQISNFNELAVLPLDVLYCINITNNDFRNVLLDDDMWIFSEYLLQDIIWFKLINTSSSNVLAVISDIYLFKPIRTKFTDIHKCHQHSYQWHLKSYDGFVSACQSTVGSADCLDKKQETIHLDLNLKMILLLCWPLLWRCCISWHW